MYDIGEKCQRISKSYNTADASEVKLRGQAWTTTYFQQRNMEEEMTSKKAYA